MHLNLQLQNTNINKLNTSVQCVKQYIYIVVISIDLTDEHLHRLLNNYNPQMLLRVQPNVGRNDSIGCTVYRVGLLPQYRLLYVQNVATMETMHITRGGSRVMLRRRSGPR